MVEDAALDIRSSNVRSTFLMWSEYTGWDEGHSFRHPRQAHQHAALRELLLLPKLLSTRHRDHVVRCNFRHNLHVAVPADDDKGAVTIPKSSRKSVESAMAMLGKPDGLRLKSPSCSCLTPPICSGEIVQEVSKIGRCARAQNRTNKTGKTARFSWWAGKQYCACCGCC